MVQCCLAYVDPVVGAVVLLAVFFPFREVRNFRLRQPALLIHRPTFCFPPIHSQPAPLKLYRYTLFSSLESTRTIYSARFPPSLSPTASSAISCPSSAPQPPT
ncbi:hypothetical protein BJX62DRAFT_100068 [Aspergillus germanicus]